MAEEVICYAWLNLGGITQKLTDQIPTLSLLHFGFGSLIIFIFSWLISSLVMAFLERDSDRLSLNQLAEKYFWVLRLSILPLLFSHFLSLYYGVQKKGFYLKGDILWGLFYFLVLLVLVLGLSAIKKWVPEK